MALIAVLLLLMLTPAVAAAFTFVIVGEQRRQEIGTCTCGTNVYGEPTRDCAFDTDFLHMNLLPPRTPMFRDVNVLGFTQVLTTPR